MGTLLLTTFVSASLLFIALAMLIASGVTTGFDTTVLLWINQHATPALDSFFLTITQLGGVLFIATVSIAIFTYLLFQKRYYKALFIALGIGGVAALNVLLKLIFERVRPDLWEWVIDETSFSFPSGHATASMALALCILALVWQTKWRTLALITLPIYVILVGLSRMYLGVHYPTDIIGGWLLATAWVSAAALMILYFRRPSRKKVEVTS